MIELILFIVGAAFIGTGIGFGGTGGTVAIVIGALEIIGAFVLMRKRHQAGGGQ